MRNLKKLLSLVMVFALVLGLGMSAFAVESADNSALKDWDLVEHKEAGALLGLLGVMKGNADGTFNPQGILTRGESMALISRALWSGDDESNLYKASNPGSFTDIGADGWSQGYINFGYVMGFISGNGDGTVTPKAQVTGAQFLKMVLCALGVADTRYTVAGAGWEAVVIADAQANELLKGITGFDPTVGLTRDIAAQIVYNMMGRNLLNADATVKKFEATGYVWLDAKQGTGGSWVLDTSSTSKTFGGEYFGYVIRTGWLVSNEYGILEDGTDSNHLLAAAEGVAANGKLYWDGFLKYQSATNEKSEPVYSYQRLLWNDVKAETTPEELGFNFEVVLIGDEILSWKALDTNVVEKTNSNNDKTINAVGNDRFVNYAKATGNLFNIDLAGVVGIKADSSIDVLQADKWNALIDALYDVLDEEELDAVLAAKSYSADVSSIATALAGITGAGDFIVVDGTIDTKLNLVARKTGTTTDDEAFNDALDDFVAAANSNYLYNSTSAIAGQKGNVTTYVDPDNNGKANYMFVTAYSLNSVKEVKAGVEARKDWGKSDVYVFDAATGIHSSVANTDFTYMFDEELAKGDVVVFHYNPFAGCYFVDEVLSLTAAKPSRYSSANGTLTLDGVAYGIAKFDGSSPVIDNTLVGNDGEFYIYNNNIVAVKGGATPDTTYAVVTDAILTYSAASGFTGENVDFRANVTLQDGTSKVYLVASVNGTSAKELVDEAEHLIEVVHEIGFVSPSLAALDAEDLGDVGAEQVIVKTKSNSATVGAYALITYTLSADGKSININPEKVGAPVSHIDDEVAADYANGSNTIALDGGPIDNDSYVVDSGSRFFIQDSKGNFSVVTGINKIPTLQFLTGKSDGIEVRAVQYVTKKALNIENKGLDVAVVSYDENLLKTEVDGNVFAIIGGGEGIGDGKWEFLMFNGTEVKKYYAESEPVANAIYKAVSIGAGDVVTFSDANRLDNKAASRGFITEYADGSFIFSGVSGVQSYNSSTVYYLIDGDSSKKLTATEAAALLPQTAEDGKFQTVINGVGTIIILASARDI